jgi:ribosomal protein L24
MKTNKIELYDTVKIVKGFFEGAEGVVIEIKGDIYTIDIRGETTLNKKRNEITKL